MARGRTRWQRYFEPKTYLGPAFGGLEAIAPSVTSLLGYHSLLRYPTNGFERYEEIRVPSRMAEPPYEAAFRELTTANVDTPSGQLGHAGHTGRPGETSRFGPLPRFETRAVSAVAANIVVPGHMMLPADRISGRPLALYREGRIKWGVAYVAPSRLRQERIPGYAWAIPRMPNYYHLMIEHILPVFDLLLRERQYFSGKPITLITSNRRELLNYMIECIGRFGITINVVEADPLTTYLPDHYLYCLPIAASTDNYYAYRPAVELIRDSLPRSALASECLYIPRTGTHVRNLIGEDGLIAALEARGFRNFVAKWSNVAEQFASFMNAREIVSVHGAALTNVMLSAPGTRVVELFATNGRKTTYLHMASQHDLTYAYAFGGVEDLKQNFSIETDAVLAALQ